VPWRFESGSVIAAIGDRVERATARILLASPFIGREVGLLVARQIRTGAAASATPRDIRLLTAFDHSVIERGRLNVEALRALRDSGATLASIPNLHAKLAIVDEWALVGSGNLTEACLDAGNIEAFASVTGPDADSAAAIFDGWWQHVLEDDGLITTTDLERALAIVPARPRDEPDRANGSAVGTPLTTGRTGYLNRFRALPRSARPGVRAPAESPPGDGPPLERVLAGSRVQPNEPAATSKLSRLDAAIDAAAPDATSYVELRARVRELIDVDAAAFATRVHHVVQGDKRVLSHHPLRARFLRGVADDPAFTRNVEIPSAIRGEYAVLLAAEMGTSAAPPGRRVESPSSAQPPPTMATPALQRVMQLMDEVAMNLDIEIERTGTGRNYRPRERDVGVEHSSGIGVYETSERPRGFEVNLAVFRQQEADDIADEMIRRMSKVTGRTITAMLWPTASFDEILGDWSATRAELIEPYFRARARLLADKSRRAIPRERREG